MLGELTIHPPVANFLWCLCAKNYENWLTVGKVSVTEFVICRQMSLLRMMCLSWFCISQLS